MDSESSNELINAVESLVDKFTKEGTPAEVKKKVAGSILFILEANIKHQVEAFCIFPLPALKKSDLDFKTPSQPKL